MLILGPNVVDLLISYSQSTFPPLTMCLARQMNLVLRLFTKVLCTTLLTLYYVNTGHSNSDKPTKSLLTCFQDKYQNDFFMLKYLKFQGFSDQTTDGF